MWLICKDLVPRERGTNRSTKIKKENRKNQKKTHGQKYNFNDFPFRFGGRERGP